MNLSIDIGNQNYRHIIHMCKNQIKYDWSSFINFTKKQHRFYWNVMFVFISNQMIICFLYMFYSFLYIIIVFWNL